MRCNREIVSVGTPHSGWHSETLGGGGTRFLHILWIISDLFVKEFYLKPSLMENIRVI